MLLAGSRRHHFGIPFLKRLKKNASLVFDMQRRKLWFIFMTPNKHETLQMMFFICPIMGSHTIAQPILKLDPDEAMKTRVVKIQLQAKIDLLCLATVMRTKNLIEFSSCVKYCLYFYICYEDYLRIKQKPVKGEKTSYQNKEKISQKY